MSGLGLRGFGGSPIKTFGDKFQIGDWGLGNTVIYKRLCDDRLQQYQSCVFCR